jgi:hypothetical protein
LDFGIAFSDADTGQSHCDATHPMYLRPLINRNPAQTNRTYAAGHDQWLWAMEPDEYDR